MKMLVIMLMLIIGITNYANAQTWREWFRQRKTQKEYLEKQIVALRAFCKKLKEGYDIAERGLNRVGDIKNGNFGDHQVYFEALEIVNPVVHKSPKVSAIVSCRSEINRYFERLFSVVHGSNDLSASERNYVYYVRDGIAQRCENAISFVNVLTSDNSSKLTDDERMRQIDMVYQSMSEMRMFSRSFCNMTRLLIQSRNRQRSEVQKSNSLLTH
jgi:hypothetical protein